MFLVARAKSLTEDRVRLATLRLRQGADKSKVAAAVSMSVETITRLLRTAPGLHVAWRFARMERQRRVARAAWTRTATRREFSPWGAHAVVCPFLVETIGRNPV